MTQGAEMPPVDDGLSTEVRRVLEVPALNSLYIELLGPMAASRESATGFLVRNSANEVLLVTNRHVVTAQNSLDPDDQRVAPCAIKVYLLAENDPDQPIHWIELAMELGDESGRPIWLEHPDYGSKVDVVAIPLPSHIEGRADLVCYQVAGPAVVRTTVTSELYVIGYMIGLRPLDNMPLGIWARGTVAWPPGLDWSGLPATLIDCRARKGQSGSPVVFYADDLAQFRSADGQIRSGPAWDLIGIYSGRIHKDSDVGIVWKRSAIEAIVERGTRPDGPDVCRLDDTVDLHTIADIVA